MQVWQLTPDAPRSPHRVSPGEWVILHTGTWPIEPGQSVWVSFRVEHPDGTSEERRVEAVWQRNEGVNSYWRAQLGPFAAGDRVIYTVHGRSPQWEWQLPLRGQRPPLPQERPARVHGTGAAPPS